MEATAAAAGVIEAGMSRLWAPEHVSEAARKELTEMELAAGVLTSGVAGSHARKAARYELDAAADKVAAGLRGMRDRRVMSTYKAPEAGHACAAGAIEESLLRFGYDPHPSGQGSMRLRRFLLQVPPEPRGGRPHRHGGPAGSRPFPPLP